MNSNDDWKMQLLVFGSVVVKCKVYMQIFPHGANELGNPCYRVQMHKANKHYVQKN